MSNNSTKSLAQQSEDEMTVHLVDDWFDPRSPRQMFQLPPPRNKGGGEVATNQIGPSRVGNADP